MILYPVPAVKRKYLVPHLYTPSSGVSFVFPKVIMDFGSVLVCFLLCPLLSHLSKLGFTETRGCVIHGEGRAGADANWKGACPIVLNSS